MLGDRPQTSSLVARAFARTESKVVGHLAAVFETVGVNQFAAQQFMGKLALPKEELARGSRSELPFNFASCFSMARSPASRSLTGRRSRVVSPRESLTQLAPPTNAR